MAFLSSRYLAPEYFMHGIVDEKIDVFAFGVLLLEIITSRRAVDTASRQSIVAWVIYASETLYLESSKELSCRSFVYLFRFGVTGKTIS